ncbi:Chorismate synthase [Melia azedarach]|uniref:Chorismate synthase n=1 Tax=Melia azedarach TaxID=155640 RepID=A0ACC1X5I0_MELAZ|nr:Chorismate synthase [Melia azedarach]
MSSELEDQCSQALSKTEDDDTPRFHKESKVSYTRDLLISLSELDICKRLPTALDQSILGELGTCATGLSQTCHDSVVQGGGYHLLKRSTAAYRPPHLCKEKVHFGVANEDFYNDETFGSSEYLSKERAEEERRRRDSFELMRKEQHKAYQGKQNKVYDEHKENLDPEIGLLLETCGRSKWFMNKYNESEEYVVSQSEASDPSGHDSTAQTYASAFVLPAVLESRSHEMNLGTKSLTGSFISEPCDTKSEHSKGYGVHSSGLAHQFLGEKKPAGGVSSSCLKGAFEVYTSQNEEVTKQKSTNLSSGRTELSQNLLASITSSATDEMPEQLHEGFEPSMLPDISEHYLNNYHSVNGWSANYRNGRRPNSAAKHGASQYLSLEKKGPDKVDMETSSKLSKGSLDRLCFSEIEGFTKDLQITEFSGNKRYSVGMNTRNDILKPHGFPLTVDESRSIQRNFEGIMSSSCSKQTVVSKSEESQPIQTRVGFNFRSEPEGKLIPVRGSCETGNLIDEICLPDEDSLITADDCILPQDFTSMAAGSSSLFTLSSQVDIADELTFLDPFLTDKRSTQLGLEGPIFDSYDMMGLEASYANLHSHQYYPQFGHYQPGKAIFKSSDAQKVQMHPKMRSSVSETYTYNPQPHHHFPSNVLSDPFHHPHAYLSWFGHSINSPLQKQIPVPNKFSSLHQGRGLPRGSPSPRSFHEMTYYAQESHPTQHFPFHCQQQNYRGLEMPIPGQIAGGIGNQAVRSRQMHPLAMAGHGSRTFDRQEDKGFFWYGQ